MNAPAPITDPCSATPGLIPVDVACALAARYATRIVGHANVPVQRAGGRTLAEEVVAAIPLPAFDQAAMDGYAMALGGEMIPRGTSMPIGGRVAAGDTASALPIGKAVRIFTGAPLPAGADAVVMQEHASLAGEEVRVHQIVRPGDNVRRQGEDICAGDVLLAPGMRLDARHLALLAAQGRSTVLVRRRPRIGVISTGNELRQPGEQLDPATLFDCNRPMIMAFAEQAGLEVVDGGWVRDHPASIADALGRIAADCDLVLTTGGASVGEEDHSAAAAGIAGASFETLRIALKPGKPAVVGRIGTCAYLGLPGNPVSALVSWLLLGGAVVAVLEGRPFQRRTGCPIRVASHFQRRPGRAEFAPAKLVAGQDGPEVEILGKGGSARLRPLVEADGLVEIHPLHAPVEPGSTVAYHPFRDGFSV